MKTPSVSLCFHLLGLLVSKEDFMVKIKEARVGLLTPCH